MKEFIKWMKCLLNRRHNRKYFIEEMLPPKQYTGHGYGSMSVCKYCGRLAFFPFKNKQEYYDLKNGNKKQP